MNPPSSELQPVLPQRAVDLAAAALRRSVLGGVFPPGSFLPPERELAARLAVNRLTLRAALAHLEAEGLVQPQQGRGVRVLDWRQEGTAVLLPHLIATADPSFLDGFLALRRAVAAEAVAAACARATEADLDALEARARALEQAPDAERLAEGNLAFSEAVVLLADNLPLRLLFNTVAGALRARPELRAAVLEDSAAVRASFSAVVALLRGRDPGRARALVHQVLEALDAASSRAAGGEG
jgi:DNA-binding FadR family transcriptional regulator